MRMLCNRYNPEWCIKKMQEIVAIKVSLDKRWQVSFVDKRGRYYDYYFVCKPTRKQMTAIKKKINHHGMSKHHCYNCGKRIPIHDLFTLDDLNYTHSKCLRG